MSFSRTYFAIVRRVFGKAIGADLDRNVSSEHGRCGWRVLVLDLLVRRHGERVAALALEPRE